MSVQTSPEEHAGLLDRLGSVVTELQQVEMDEMAPAAQLQFVRDLEVLRRRLDHGTDRATGLLDASAAFSLDGHRNARDAVKHLGRLSGGEALGRTQTIRALRLLPVVAEAYTTGRIPTRPHAAHRPRGRQPSGRSAPRGS